MTSQHKYTKTHFPIDTRTAETADFGDFVRYGPLHWTERVIFWACKTADVLSNDPGRWPPSCVGNWQFLLNSLVWVDWVSHRSHCCDQLCGQTKLASVCPELIANCKSLGCCKYCLNGYWNCPHFKFAQTHFSLHDSAVKRSTSASWGLLSWTYVVPCQSSFHKCAPETFLCLIWCFYKGTFPLQTLLNIHHAAGVVVWEEENSRRDAQTASESFEQSNARPGQRETKDGTTGKEDHHGHQENGKTRADGASRKILSSNWADRRFERSYLWGVLTRTPDKKALFCRMLWRSWQRIWWGRGDMWRSSCWWGPTFRRCHWRFRPWGRLLRWQMPWKVSRKQWARWTNRFVLKCIYKVLCGLSFWKFSEKLSWKTVDHLLCHLVFRWSSLRSKRSWWNLRSNQRSWTWKKKWWMMPLMMQWVMKTMKRKGMFCCQESCSFRVNHRRAETAVHDSREVQCRKTVSTHVKDARFCPERIPTKSRGASSTWVWADHCFNGTLTQKDKLKSGRATFEYGDEFRLLYNFKFNVAAKRSCSKCWTNWAFRSKGIYQQFRKQEGRFQQEPPQNSPSLLQRGASTTPTPT